MVYKQFVLEEDHWSYCSAFNHFSVSAAPDNISQETGNVTLSNRATTLQESTNKQSHAATIETINWIIVSLLL